MAIQFFEEEALRTVKFPTISEVPLTLAELPQIQELVTMSGIGVGLSLGATENVAVIRKISGAIVKKYMKETTAPTKTSLCATLTAFGMAIPNIDIEFYDRTAGKTLAVNSTDSNGRAFYTFEHGSPGIQKSIESCVYPRNVMSIIPGMSSTKLLTVWTILLKSRNRTDVWDRLQARALGEPLPRYFWAEKPHTVIGLAGWIDFVELIPVLEGQTLRYEVGVSAYCNTPEPNPPADKCAEYRKRTWWRFGLYASNTPEAPTLIAEGDINLDYHLVYEITARQIRLAERRYVG